MGFFKTLFTGKEDTEEEKKKQKERNDFDVFKYDGIENLRIGRTDYAIECFDRALAIHDDVEIHRFYANALLRKNDIDGAIEELEAIRNSDPDDVNNLLSLAELYFQTEDYAKMTDACNDAMSKDQSLATPHFILAKMYNAKNEYNTAIGQLSQAISLKPDFNEAMLLRAKVLYAMQQYNEANNDIDKLLKSDDQNDEILQMKAECCEALGERDKAKEFYNKVIEFNPYNAQAYMQLGSILKAEGKDEEAGQLLEEGQKLTAEQAMESTDETADIGQKTEEAYKSINPFNH